MLEAMAEWMSYPMYYAFAGAPPPARAGASHATIFPYGPFRVGDGHDVILGLQNEREWSAFCAQVLGQPDLAADPRFSSNSFRAVHKEELTAIIVDAFSDLVAEAVTAKLDAAGIANARMNDMADLWEHRQLQARGRWREVDTPAGPIPALLPPGGLGDLEPRMDAVPALGAQARSILAELDYAPHEIDAFEYEGVI